MFLWLLDSRKKKRWKIPSRQCEFGGCFGGTVSLCGGEVGAIGRNLSVLGDA